MAVSNPVRRYLTWFCCDLDLTATLCFDLFLFFFQVLDTGISKLRSHLRICAFPFLLLLCPGRNRPEVGSLAPSVCCRRIGRLVAGQHWGCYLPSFQGSFTSQCTNSLSKYELLRYLLMIELQNFNSSILDRHHLQLVMSVATPSSRTMPYR